MKTTIISLFFLAATTVLAAPGLFPRQTNTTCSMCVSSPNNCDITAPCSNFLGKEYSACRPGYKAGQYANNDTIHQWRINTIQGQISRVWIAPGVVCDTLCDNPYGQNRCSEVAVNNACAPLPPPTRK